MAFQFHSLAGLRGKQRQLRQLITANGPKEDIAIVPFRGAEHCRFVPIIQTTSILRYRALWILFTAVSV